MKKKIRRNFPRLARCLKKQCPQRSKKPCWLFGAPSLLPGLNIHGYFLSEIGLGESARLIYSALETQNIKISACNRYLKARENDQTFCGKLNTSAPHKASLSIDGLYGFRRLFSKVCKHKYNVAYPFLDLETCSKQYLGYLSKFDRIWAPSSFIFESLRQHGVGNIDLVKQPIRMPSVTPDFTLSADALRILFFFDFDSFSSRKNPEAVISAFQIAFPKNEDVKLTVKTRGQRDDGRRAWLAKQAFLDSRITIIDEILSRVGMELLIARHDVFLSLHRSEGLGMGCAEALLAGKVVVATNYGGSTDFVNEKTGFPVDWNRISVGRGDYVLADGATWADPFVEHAAVQLRTIYDEPTNASLKAENGFRHLEQNNSFKVIGSQMCSLLQRDVLID